MKLNTSHIINSNSVDLSKIKIGFSCAARNELPNHFERPDRTNYKSKCILLNENDSFAVSLKNDQMIYRSSWHGDSLHGRVVKCVSQYLMDESYHCRMEMAQERPVKWGKEGGFTLVLHFFSTINNWLVII